MSASVCKCGKHALPEFAPWVSFPDVVHTAERCGRFVRLDVEHPSFVGNMKLTVTWPDMETTAPLASGGVKPDVPGVPSSVTEAVVHGGDESHSLVKRYTWRTLRDDRVRSEHAVPLHMQNFRWTMDLPPGLDEMAGHRFRCWVDAPFYPAGPRRWKRGQKRTSRDRRRARETPMARFASIRVEKGTTIHAEDIPRAGERTRERALRAPFGGAW